MTNQPNPAMNRRKPTKKVAGLHHHIAVGGKPKDYEACQGVNGSTVPGYKERGEKSK